MAFYKNVLVCKREFMQLQESLLKAGKVMAAAPHRRSKFVCYRCGFYFEVDEVSAHPCYRSQVKCPHCLYRFVPLSRKAPQQVQQAQAEQQRVEHRCKICPHCRSVYTLSDEQHQRICQAQLVRCPDCYQQINRQMYSNHREKCVLCRCYKCNVLLYKHYLADHLITCARDPLARADGHLTRRQAAPKIQVNHYYHFRNRPQQSSRNFEPQHQQAPPGSANSPVPISIENWLRH